MRENKRGVDRLDLPTEREKGWARSFLSSFEDHNLVDLEASFSAFLRQRRAPEVLDDILAFGEVQASIATAVEQADGARLHGPSTIQAALVALGEASSATLTSGADLLVLLQKASSSLSGENPLDPLQLANVAIAYHGDLLKSWKGTSPLPQPHFFAALKIALIRNSALLRQAA